MPARESGEPDAGAKRRRMPKQQRSRELVGRILSTAGELFAERGYAETTTNAVADRAGVSVGSLYQFFADKDEILTALQEEWTTRLGAALDERLRADLGAEPAETIENVLDIHAAFNRDPPGLLGFLLTSPTPAPSEPRVIDAIRGRLVEKLEILAPQMPDQRRFTAASMIVHISNGLYTVGLTAGATDAAVRAEVRQALLHYVQSLLAEE
ncbi:TetR/AcrR family transcriptional regulator [Saccharopolyspora sp. HNM0983]|uniref:TetR/AcrR family transcriptional regulator n=1 Tax=Saccharopolyspora montiporae TaxID=2781240 RepID=A0A929FYV8_9PSEU|nr:TetR/AcrR family transcriptional regulator [Saccharopolyspora sp. HNM0983]MBE9373749.1 TetR/AcrR family transcriptional regulator [Saccharopolyspora sp. HNM0983]